MVTSDGSSRTYGNWIMQRSPGLGSMGLLGTGLIFVGLIASLAVLGFGGMRPAVVVAAVFALALLVVGTPVGGTLGRRLQFWRSRSRGETVWRSGVFSPNGHRSVRLPGMLGRIQPLTYVDALGTTATALYNPVAGTYTMVVRCAPQGPAMQDQDQVDAWVDNYAGLLNAEAAEDGLIAAAAITDSAPDPGGTLRAEVERHRSDNAPEMASAVMDEVASDLPGRTHRDATYLAFTYDRRQLARGQGSGHEEQLADLARRVPGLIGMCQSSGGGAARMAGEHELARCVRFAYDPAAEGFADEAEREGVSGDESVVPWSEAGPVSCQTGWSSLRSDSGLHVTWEMVQPPQAAVEELSLKRLLAAQGEVVRKRIALIYRPHGPDRSMRIAETDLSTATMAANTNERKRISARAKRIIAAAEKSSTEVAAGSALTRFSLMVTATVTRQEDLPRAVRAMESRAGSVPLRLRRCYGSQDAAFAATLPVGFVPWLHTKIPTTVREMLL